MVPARSAVVQMKICPTERVKDDSDLSSIHDIERVCTLVTADNVTSVSFEQVDMLHVKYSEH